MLSEMKFWETWLCLSLCVFQFCLLGAVAVHARCVWCWTEGTKGAEYGGL